MWRAINRSLVVGLGAAVLIGAPAAAARDKSHPPIPVDSPATWFTAKDYPPAARRSMQQGRVAVELTIDATGRVTECRVVASSGSAELDKATCDLVRLRGRFEPALDKQGNPVPGVYSVATRWELQGGIKPVALDKPWHAVSVATIDADGKPMACRQEESVPANTWTPFPCATVNTLPAYYGLFTRTGIAGTAPIDVTFEAGIVPDGAPVQPMVYSRPGRTLLSLLVMRLDIGVDGKIAGCKVVMDSGTNEPGDPCARARGMFMPPAKPASVVLTRAISRVGQ